MIKVAKFGGSSVADAGQFKKVKDIVRSDPDRRFVVVSAAGKRFADDNKITDLLLLVNAHINYHVDCTSLLAHRREVRGVLLGHQEPLARVHREPR